MTLRQYIYELQALAAVEGDTLEVDSTSWDGRRVAAGRPEVKYRKVLTKRESKASFWYSSQGEATRGEKVVRV